MPLVPRRSAAYREYSVEQWKALLERLTAPSMPKQASGSRLEEERRMINRRACLLARMVQRLCCQYQWRMAAEVLEVLLAGHYPADQFCYKAGMLLHENLASPEKTNFFIRHSRCLLVADKKELALEYIIYCLKRMRYSHLRTFFQEHLKVDRKMLRPNEKLDAFIRGYLGLLHYLQWLPHASRSRSDSVTVPGADDDVVGESYEELASVASALDKWRPLFTPDDENSTSASQETTDIFLIKTLELLLRYDRTDEAQDIVEGYLDSRSDNCLHAALYVNAVAQDRSDASEESADSHRLEILAKICEADPTNPHVLEYVQLIECCERGEENVVECLRLLADFVDCPDNKDSVEAWRLLCRITLGASHSRDVGVSTCGSRLWHERGDYWLPYHFPPWLEGEPATWLLKATFLQALGQTAGSFIKAVEGKLQEHDIELLEKFREAQEQMLHAPSPNTLLDEVLEAAHCLKRSHPPVTYQSHRHPCGEQTHGTGLWL